MSGWLFTKSAIDKASPPTQTPRLERGLGKLQRVQHSAARQLSRLSRTSHAQSFHAEGIEFFLGNCQTQGATDRAHPVWLKDANREATHTAPSCTCTAASLSVMCAASPRLGQHMNYLRLPLQLATVADTMQQSRLGSMHAPTHPPSLVSDCACTITKLRSWTLSSEGTASSQVPSACNIKEQPGCPMLTNEDFRGTSSSHNTHIHGLHTTLQTI